MFTCGLPESPEAACKLGYVMAHVQKLGLEPGLTAARVLPIYSSAQPASPASEQKGQWGVQSGGFKAEF